MIISIIIMSIITIMATVTTTVWFVDFLYHSEYYAEEDIAGLLVSFLTLFILYVTTIKLWINMLGI